MDRSARELERQGSAGDVEARARMLRSKVRSGELRAGHVRLAAVLGDEAARLLHPDAEMPKPTTAQLAKLLSTRTLHGASGVTRRTYCGIRLGASPHDLLPGGRPTCGRCLGSEQWRCAVQASLMQLVTTAHAVDPLAAFRACIALIEEALPAAVGEAELVERLLALARWAYGDGDVPKDEQSPSAWDPAGIHEEGIVAWMRGLMSAAWSISRRGEMTAAQIERLTASTSQWVRGTTDGLYHLRVATDNVRARLLPWLLGDEDPMPVFVHFLETTVIPRA